MILDDDETVKEKVVDDLYSIEYVKQVILEIMNESYENVLADKTYNDYSVVQGAFRLHFKQPIELRYVSGKTVTSIVLGVGFYVYEYREMLQSMNSQNYSLKYAGFRELGINPIVEKTLNNFSIKSREKGLKIVDIRNIKFLVTRL